MFKRTVLSSALLAFSGLSCGGPARPNILLVIIDTARADRFPFGGYGRPTAPLLSALARDGTIYTRAYSPAPWTVPAHASLFTGQYPSLHHTDCGALRLPDQATTLAEILRDAGYRTVGYTANPWLGQKYNFQQGFETWGETWREVVPGSEDTGAGITNEKVLRFLNWRRDTPEGRARPFFLFINYFEAHLPYHPPEPERSRFLAPGRDPQRVARLASLGHPEEMRYIMGRSDLTAGDLQILNELYDGEIAYVDRRLGEVIDALRRQEILDDMIVVVTSDHGENIGDHHMMDHKMSVHDTLLHVPLVLRFPGRVPAGRTIDRPVQLHDLFPTLLALAGVTPPPGTTVEAVALPGTGVTPAGRQDDTPLVGEFVGPPVDFLQVMQELFPEDDLSRFNRKLVALRLGDYKIHWGSDGRHALFRVSDDPGETRDRAAEEPERLREYARLVAGWLDRPARHSRQEPVRVSGRPMRIPGRAPSPLRRTRAILLCGL